MRALVACEESQTVLKAFLRLGHDAYSCDLLPASGEYPERHYQCDIREVLGPRYRWDMCLAFPPCTHLSRSGGRHFAQKRADGRQQEGIDFFMIFTRLHWIPKVCIENPIGVMSWVYRKPDQIIQPFEYGHDASKKTCLWLKDLPRLTPTNFVAPGADGRYANQSKSGRCNLLRTPDRARIRSKTYEGVAEAMANQWT